MSDLKLEQIRLAVHPADIECRLDPSEVCCSRVHMSWMLPCIIWHTVYKLCQHVRVVLQ